MNKNLLIAILTFAFLVAIIGFYLSCKQKDSLAGAKVAYKLTADELYNAFIDNENQANELYIDKIIEVKGRVIKVTKKENKNQLVLKAKNAMAGGINCSFDNIDHSFKQGEIVSIKGKCQGILLDVILNNCIEAD